MITAKNALDALCKAGFAKNWRKKTEHERGHRVTDFTVDSDAFRISNETYGKRSFLYFYCLNKEMAYKIVEILRQAGGNPGVSWNGGPDKGHLEMQVSYFKGWRWWE